MKLGFRSKLFLLSFGLIAASVAVGQAFLSAEMEKSLLGRIRGDLRVRLQLVERAVSEAALPAGAFAAWDPLADDLGRRADARVTIIDRRGVVLGDSEVDVSRIPHVENHGRRPEVLAANATGRGEAMRRSTTVGRRMMYLGTPFEATTTRGVVRVALPLDEVDAAVARVRRVIWVASLLAIGIAVVLSSAAAQLASRGVRRLTEVARRMAAGDLDARSGLRSGEDEFAALGGTLDRLAEGLKNGLEQLTGERDRLESVLDGMREGVLMLDAQGRVELVNPAFREMLLLDTDSRGRSLLEAVRNADLSDLLERAMRHDEATSGEIEVAGLRPRSLLVRASPMAMPKGALLAVFVDVTEIKKLESLRRDFVANVSHELRTPIAAIRSATETLESGALSDPGASTHLLQIVARNAERLDRLVADLLDLARIESRRFDLKPQSVHLGEFLGRLVELHRERARNRRITLATSVPDDVGPLRADPRALEQVLTNLIDNAVKYASEGSDVTVAAVGDGGSVRLSVSDGGPGIDAKHLSRIFERFYRVDAGRSREQGGTGLGLSIVKHLSEAMGGAAAVHSEVGRGTTFTVSLPRA